jgi:hypothetical protein
MQIGTQPLVLGRQTVILFLVHLFVDDVLLSHAQGTTSSRLANLRCSSGRLHARFQIAITASRCRDVGLIGRLNTLETQDFLTRGCKLAVGPAFIALQVNMLSQKITKLTVMPM